MQMEEGQSDIAILELKGQISDDGPVRVVKLLEEGRRETGRKI